MALYTQVCARRYQPWFEFDAFSCPQHPRDYDVIIDVNSLHALGDGGWKVKYPILEAAEDATTALSPAQGATVAVLGLYNRGKTWIISQLCGISLDHSYFTHTEGISFTIPTNELGKNMLFIDTAGAQRPVKSTAACF